MFPKPSVPSLTTAVGASDISLAILFHDRSGTTVTDVAGSNSFTATAADRWDIGSLTSEDSSYHRAHAEYGWAGDGTEYIEGPAALASGWVADVEDTANPWYLIIHGRWEGQGFLFSKTDSSGNGLEITTSSGGNLVARWKGQYTTLYNTTGSLITGGTLSAGDEFVLAIRSQVSSGDSLTTNASVRLWVNGTLLGNGVTNGILTAGAGTKDPTAPIRIGSGYSSPTFQLTNTVLYSVVVREGLISMEDLEDQITEDTAVTATSANSEEFYRKYFQDRLFAYSTTANADRAQELCDMDRPTLYVGDSQMIMHPNRWPNYLRTLYVDDANITGRCMGSNQDGSGTIGITPSFVGSTADSAITPANSQIATSSGVGLVYSEYVDGARIGSQFITFDLSGNPTTTDEWVTLTMTANTGAYQTSTATDIWLTNLTFATAKLSIMQDMSDPVTNLGLQITKFQGTPAINTEVNVPATAPDNAMLQYATALATPGTTDPTSIDVTIAEQSPDATQANGDDCAVVNVYLYDGGANSGNPVTTGFQDYSVAIPSFSPFDCNTYCGPCGYGDLINGAFFPTAIFIGHGHNSEAGYPTNFSRDYLALIENIEGGIRIARCYHYNNYSDTTVFDREIFLCCVAPWTLDAGTYSGPDAITIRDVTESLCLSKGGIFVDLLEAYKYLNPFTGGSDSVHPESRAEAEDAATKVYTSICNQAVGVTPGAVVVGKGTLKFHNNLGLSL